MFGNWTKSSYKKGKVCVVSHFESLSLKCEMTVMSLDQVPGHDKHNLRFLQKRLDKKIGTLEFVQFIYIYIYIDTHTHTKV